MTPNNLALMKVSLNRVFTLIFFAENCLGEIHDFSCRIKRKIFQQFIQDKNIRIIMVDDYPSEIKNEILYIKRNGKMAWIQSQEELIPMEYFLH